MPLSGRLVADEAAVLQAEELSKLAGHGDQHEVRVLPAGNALPQVMDTRELESSAGGCLLVLASPCGELPDQEPHDDEEDLGGDDRLDG